MDDREIPVIEDAPAYWIGPNGMILPVYEYHITEICRCPEAFGFSKEFIEEVYKKNNEIWGEEGKTREELMQILYNKGWVRIRFYSTYKNYFRVDLGILTDKHKNLLCKWAGALIKSMGNKYKDAVVFIRDFSGDLLTRKYSVEDITKDVFLNSIVSESVFLVPIGSVFEFLEGKGDR